jgi:hypothetical protein
MNRCVLTCGADGWSVFRRVLMVWYVVDPLRFWNIDKRQTWRTLAAWWGTFGVRTETVLFILLLTHSRRSKWKAVQDRLLHVVLCILVQAYRRFGYSYCLHNQGLPWEEAVGTSKSPVNLYQSTWRNIPGRHENVNSHGIRCCFLSLT